MIENYILIYLILYIVLELYEISWQKAPNIAGMLGHLYKYYEKNIFLFFLMHPTFYFSLFFAMLTNFNTYATILLGLKTLDIVTKIKLIEQIFKKQDLTKELSLMLLAPINKFLPYLGLLFYTPLVYIALAPNSF